MGVRFSEVDLATRSDSNVIHLHVSGTMNHEDYEIFGPDIEQVIQKHGKIRVLLELDDFHGWTARALWDDIKFDIQHFRDIERIAMVGDSTWEKWMAVFCKPFTAATIKYFDASDIDAAWDWISEK
ncbi:hypothetical protein Enr13x_19410 [Stieleria neptunia]|uniref:STAS/SEC14 domain-containing protein n=1 Tax=Stieleria neptunia TaxID=2527979 RepID=A0A518HMN3_9BACT|nr:STAS/SEC14 domain-containing protein [Stieleria neptunia]QDV42098.1 hypothetical protein Enr13x_19410 [Stieleria neptunia]